jgi:DNA-binding XRE family transcriptional regulator
MAKRSDAAARIEALRMGRGETQEEFGKHARVNPTAVSAWERGAYEPSSETWLLLAKLAPFPDNIWFLERAGLDQQTILSAAGKILKDRMAPAAPGEIVRIPLVRKTAKGIEKTDLFPLPATLIQNPAHTICLLVDENSSGPFLADGDVVIVDMSKDPSDLRSFLGQFVLVEFAEKAGRRPQEEGWPEGLFIGLLSLLRYDALGLVWAAHLIGVTHPLGFWQWKYTTDNPEVLGRPKDISRAANEALLQAPENIRLAKGCRIVGRAIGWFKALEKKK